MQASDVLALLARVFVGAILIVAATAKLKAGQADFFRRVYAYDLLPQRAAWILSRLLPSVELTVGVLVALGLFAAVASAASALLLLTFTGAVSLSLLRGRNQPCGCGGDQRPVSWSLVGRNSFLLLLSLALMRFGPGVVSVEGALSASGLASVFTLPLAATVCLFSVWMSGLGRPRSSVQTSTVGTNFGEAAHV